MSDLLGTCLRSMARVWSKTQAAYEENGDPRAHYKEYVEMGDILYHATGGERGACGEYTPDEPGGECPGAEAYRRQP